MIRGELATGAQKSRHNLVFGRSVRIATMMQSWFLRRGTATSDSSADALARAAKPFVLSLLSFHAVAHDAGRNTTPCGTSPLVTRRQRAMSSLRASATIIVLR